MFIFTSLFIGMRSQPPNAFEKQADGVLFDLTKQKATDAQWLKVQVCSEDIIRVIAAPEKSFSTRPSLMVDKTSWAPAQWSMNEKGDHVEIATSKLMVRVQPETGAVAFYDANGQLLLQEKVGGGKIITAAEVMGEKTYHIQQLFESPKDEAFYGLGAHQNAVMNYKGHDVDLWQHNIVDVIPFLVSSKNYGILWDNYSRTKFGDIRDYQPLSSLTLYNQQGEQGGWTVEYFKDSKFGSLITSQTEANIEHDFVDQPGVYPEGFNVNQGSIRWSGEIGSDQSGRSQIQTLLVGLRQNVAERRTDGGCLAAELAAVDALASSADGGRQTLSNQNRMDTRRWCDWFEVSNSGRKSI